MFTKRVFGMMTLIMGIVLFVSFFLAFTACSNGRDKSLVGRWRIDGGYDVLEFSQDGKGAIDEDEFIFTWSTANGRLKIKTQIDDGDHEFVCDYSINGSKLTIKDEGYLSGTFTKLGENVISGQQSASEVAQPSAPSQSESQPAQQTGKSIKITGIDPKYGFFLVTLSKSNGADYKDFQSSIANSNDYTGNINMDKGTLTATLHNIDGDWDNWNGSGSYFVVLHLRDEDPGFPVFVSKNKIPFNNAITEIAFSNFAFVERLDPQ